LSSSFPLVVFIRFIIPYCQGFFRVNFAENVRVLHFLDGLQISWRRWEGRKTLRRGGSPLLFVRCFSREIEKGPDGGLMDDGLRP
jgi:hypothetical protein